MEGVKLVSNNAINKKFAVLDGIDFSDSFGDDEQSEVDEFGSLDDTDLPIVAAKPASSKTNTSGTETPKITSELPKYELFTDSFEFSDSIKSKLDSDKSNNNENKDRIITKQNIQNYGSQTRPILIEDLQDSFEFSDASNSNNNKYNNQVKEPSPELFDDKSASESEITHVSQHPEVKLDSFDFGSDDELPVIKYEKSNTPPQKRPSSSQKSSSVIKRHHSPPRNSRISSSDIIRIGMSSPRNESSEEIIAPSRKNKVPIQSSPLSPSYRPSSGSSVLHTSNRNSPTKPSKFVNTFNIPATTTTTRTLSTTTTTATTTTRTIKPPSNHTLLLATQRPSIESSKPATGETTTKIVQPIILSREQEAVLQQVLRGVSLFYTGSAGTGKSVLLRSIIKALREKHGTGVAVTASTGLAACNIGGTTLHSFGGIGLGNIAVDKLIKKIRRNKKSFRRWLETKVLVIDEISMVDGELLDKLSHIAQTLRNNKQPFGGIQLVACGDFYQLPPVVKKHNAEGELNENIEVIFSFECEAWRKTIQQTIILKEVFRQKGDQTFIDMLNEMRDGRLSERTIREFRRLSRPLICPEGIVPAELYATRTEVESANKRRLNAIKGEATHYRAMDSGSLPEPQKSSCLSNFLAPMDLYLKVNAQVMCIKNFDETLVNGSLGTIVDFMDKDTYMKAYGPEEAENVMDDEMLKDFVFNEKIDKIPGEKTDENFGSKINTTTTQAISQKNSSPDEIKSAERKQEINNDLMGDFKNRKFPLVKFLSPDGVNTRTVLVEPEQWTVEDEDGKVLVSRVQFPLMLAWSLSIHKSQGQTLSRVKVDLKRVFENGQSYVALSRATSRDGLQVLNFMENKVTSHPKVMKFYKSLNSI
ncbi:PIF1 [Candida jiufengensis]|uniref:PIF1 n=1 Tax=Candida jiufengensis TaxID=497108 RepID=UPI002223F3C3|nr:PIF1 [Candida jiufengensis]KAI5957132.1 PIF1 [Candida jiufengensis]